MHPVLPRRRVVAALLLLAGGGMTAAVHAQGGKQVLTGAAAQKSPQADLSSPTRTR
ncbi:MAG: hypothetical protein ABW220_11680 [Burkholderiaceae bacterium]